MHYFYMANYNSISTILNFSIMKFLKKIFFLAAILTSIMAFSQEKNETIKLNLTVKDYNNKPVPGAIILLDNGLKTFSSNHFYHGKAVEVKGNEQAQYRNGVNYISGSG